MRELLPEEKPIKVSIRQIANSINYKNNMKRILVIEDEEIVRANILEILESGSFNAIGAKNGLQGVQLAHQQVPDLIVCDITMPELDGYGVLKLLRQNPLTLTIPFIFLTARADKNEMRVGMNLGADDYLTKPFRRKELLGAISARLEKDAAYRERYAIALEQYKTKLNYSLHYDELTKLPTQLLLREKFQELYRETPADQTLAIMLVGLDRFERIAEALGQTGKDNLIQEVVCRLIGCVSFNDTMARLNTNQFAIILAPGEEERDSEEVAATILDTLNQPFGLDRHEIPVIASIGIATAPHDGDDLDHLIAHAQTALSHARELGSNQYQFYTPDIQSVSLEKLTLEASLRHALERCEFLVYYQPQVELLEGRIVGAEALVRWQHPERGLVAPGEFIPLAEESGLIAPIGEWVLREACQQVKRWQANGLPAVSISVNLSFRQFNQPDLIRRLVHILKETSLDAAYLELELTESVLVQNVEAAKRRLKALKAQGVKISLDDFGTGYSSLKYLQQFPFDTLKIDRCFVRNINIDTKNAALTTAIISMARGLHLNVVAEGVETQEELTFLRQQRCNTMQGYLFSRPVSADEFEEMLRRGKTLSIPKSDRFGNSFFF